MNWLDLFAVVSTDSRDGSETYIIALPILCNLVNQFTESDQILYVH